MDSLQQISTKVLIGIQARSSSSRFPGKGQAIIGTKNITEHILDAARDAADYCGRDQKIVKLPGYSIQNRIYCNVSLLLPQGDRLRDMFRGKCHIVEGDENDVLSRFNKAYNTFKPDYIVRLTGDCPLIPSYVISKHIKTAIYGHNDYVTNADPRFRTDVDGYDCEVISKRLFEYLVGCQLTDYHREHVTPYLRENPPPWARISNIIGHLDFSNVKLSIDTEEDLARAREFYGSLDEKIKSAATYRRRSTVQRL